MAASVQIHLIDYLNTAYRPDREYIDGDLWERNAGKFEHSRVQALLAGWFGARERGTGFMVLTEQRVQVSATRVRIPDVALVPVGAHPEVLPDPPVLVIEILSSGDSYAETEHRAGDYIHMGVQHLWIVDPATRTGEMWTGQAWVRESQLTAGASISLDLATLFDAIERAS